MNMKKTCTTCKVTKPLSDYYKYRRCKDGHRNYCKQCAVKSQTEYYTKNRVRILAQHKKWDKEWKEREEAVKLSKT